MNADKAAEIVFAGREITLKTDDGKEIQVMVFPVGVGHIRRFNKAVEDVLPKILNQIDVSRFKKDASIGDFAPMIVPIVISDLLEIVAACIKGVDILSDNFPHWHLPPLIEAWIDVSFGKEEKIRPWVEVVENVLAKLTGKKIGIWETLSKSLSAPAMTSITS